MHLPTMSMASEAVAPALMADPRAKMRAPTAIEYLRLMESATLPAIMPVTAEGRRISCRATARSQLWRAMRAGSGEEERGNARPQ